MEKILAFGVIGLATGAIYAIAASGLVLTYTTSGIFNIAHGAIGMVSAFLYWQLRFDWQWPTWLSILLVLFVFAPLFGASIERFILRGLQGSSEVTKVIVTVGLMVGLIGLVGWIWPSESRAEYRPFFDGDQISLGGNNITYHTIITVLCAIAVAIALRWLLYSTRAGVAMRAVVDNRGLAELNGARPNRISMLAWSASTMLAALAGILLAGTLQLNVIPLTLLVVNAYSAAIFGRLRNLTATFVAAIALGLANSYLIGYGEVLHLNDPIGDFSLTGIRASIPMIVLFIALLLLPQSRLRGGGLLQRRETTPEPNWPMSVFGVVVGMLFVVGISGWFGRGDLLSLSNALIFAIAALSLVPLTGYAGLISLAPLTFAGLGAALMSKLPGGGSIVTLIAVMLIVAAIGAVVALPALRLSGIYLALATGAFAVVMTNLVFNQGAWFPQANVDVPPLSLGFWQVDSPRAQFIMLAAAFCVLGLGVIALRKSTLGRRLVAMKDSEVAIGTLGQNTRALKLVAFSISAAIGAAAGGLVGTRVVITDTYSFVVGLSVVLLAVVGGVSAVSGALLGGVFLGGNLILADMVPSLSNVSKVLPGTLGITMGRSPDGVSGELRNNYSESAKMWWPLGVGTAGGILLWALAQTDVISKWTFTVALIVLVVPVMPMLPALFVDAIPLNRRIAMGALMAAALATAVGIDWGTVVDVNGQRVVIIVLYVAILAIASRNLLVPAADEATSPDRIGLTERFTPQQITEAESALGVRL
jgi:branched-chain amino acid transport system permease protein